MLHKSMSVKLALISTLIASGSALAQNLPDEINHTRYLQIYQSLDGIFQQKSAEYQKLSAQKSEIETTIAQMEKDQIEIPARNSELNQIIAQKRAEVAAINQQISQIESVLSQVIDDLRRLDNTLAQLNRDYAQASNQLRSIDVARAQANQDTAAARARLEREMREESETARVLQRLNNEMNQALDQRQQNERQRRELTRDAEEARRQLPNYRASVAQNTNNLNSKKAILTELQSKLPAIKADVANQQAKVTAADARLNPEKSKLAQLSNQLNSLNAQIGALTAENNQLTARIAQNRVRMNNMNNAALEQAKTRLEQEVAALTNQSAGLRNTLAANQATINEKTVLLNQKKEELRQQRPRTPEFMRIAREIAQLDDEIDNIQKVNKNIHRQLAPVDAQIASKNQQIAQYTAAMNANDQQRTQLQNEITAAEAKIAENTQALPIKIAAKKEAEASVNAQAQVVSALEAEKASAQRELARSQALETQLSNQITVTSGEVQKIERDIAGANAKIKEMEDAIASYPQAIQRLENHNRQLDARITEARRDISTNERLFARIQQDRVEAQRNYDAFSSRLEGINRDFASQEAQVRGIQSNINENQTQRDSLARYNQDSINRYDALKSQKAAAEKEITDATGELNINTQDLQTIASQLPKLRSDLSSITPRVSAAEASMNQASSRAQSASVDYQNRRSLYDRYLSEAKTLGQERGGIGGQDGLRDGATEARSVAQRLAQENGAAEGKWQAIRRGYVRGEISGYSAGFEIGMTSRPDMTRGDAEGRVAGAKRAKDEANMVKKPAIYLEILAERLKNDDPSKRKLVSDLVSAKLSSVNNFQSEIPELTSEELQRSQEISSSLDALIAQSEIEIRKVLEIRDRIGNSRNVYNAPTSAPGAQNADCSAVYKNVKDFVDACKATFAARYQSVYNTSHAEAFHTNYGELFSSGVERIADAELIRQYGAYSSEAMKVGREVGLSAGKEEIYRQSFTAAELASYNDAAPKEEARVSQEAQDLVQDLLAKNPAVAQKKDAVIDTDSSFGVSPGVDASVKLSLKNIGNVDSSSTSLIRVTQLSNNVSMESRESVIPSVPGRSLKDVNVLNLKVSENAIPGSRIVVAGEIIHPGNLYRSTRTETFRIDSLLGINPEAALNIEFDETPKISGFFGGTNKHDVEVSLAPKYAGVEGGYTVTLEEIGGRNAEIITAEARTGELDRNSVKKVEVTYKLKKESKGKQVILRLTIKNGQTVVKSQDLKVVPK